MAEADDRVLDYRRPSGSKEPARAMRDSALLLIASALLFGPPLGFLVLGGIDVDDGLALLGLIGVAAWAVGGASMVWITKRRIHPVHVPGDRPNRIILAFAFSGLSLALFLATAGFGVAKARRTFRQISCHENLRSLGAAMYLYASDNRGFLPPDLVTLVRAKVLGEQTLQTLRCPEALTPKPVVVTPATTDHDLIAAGAAAYVYLGDASVKLSSIRNASSAPIVIELPGNHPQGLVLYADGHNEAKAPQEVALILSEHLAQRRAAATQPVSPSTRQVIPGNGPDETSPQ